ncbi:CoA-binding protein [Anaeromyxobacter diazotrophicus]|uniref:CoA-binding protein n=1 Tax=Anaeromyxobacter diazotrophicus TaxID=2590199 RepID=A0A7I9VTJ2_9BACT|nr:CoA-binding protein [Anaeromyxobacter diazotrophicus]GEJ59470.1 CoA-binding protein [Anaeromyxobacter diazotrophicus]
MDYRQNLVVEEERVAELIRSSRRVAVLGIKTEAQAGQPAFYVAEHLARAGVEVIPVPVYYPEVKEILGRPVHRRLADLPPPVDIVDVFRRPADIPQHLPDLLALRPRAVWFQLGIRHDEAARTLAEAGLLVVQDRCLMVDWQRYGAGQR